jgi:lanosterol synthase
MMYMPTETQVSALWPQCDLPESGKMPFTDYSRWRLLVNDGGRHTWHYLQTDEECKKWPQNDVDRYWLGIPLVRVIQVSCLGALPQYQIELA